MPEDPFRPLLEQLADILKMVEESAKNPLSQPLDPMIEKRLEVIETAVQNFQDIADEQIRKEGKNPEGGIATLKKGVYTDEEKRVLRRCADLGRNAMILRLGLKLASEESKMPKKLREVGKNTKKSIQKRKGKFKGMEGDSKWKRL